jgi:hypothetical protein
MAQSGTFSVAVFRMDKVRLAGMLNPVRNDIRTKATSGFTDEEIVDKAAKNCAAEKKGINVNDRWCDDWVRSYLQYWPKDGDREPITGNVYNGCKFWLFA